MVRLFRHYVPVPLVLLAGAEAVVFFIAIYMGKYLRFSTAATGLPQGEGVNGKAMVFTLVMLGIMTAMGLFERNFWEGKADMILRVGVSFLLGLFGMTLLYYVFPSLYLGRGEFGLAFSLAFAGVLITRYLFLHLSDRGVLQRRILVLGAGHKAAQLEQLLRSDGSQSFQLVGYVPMNEDFEAVESSKVLPLRSTLLAVAREHGVNEIVVAMDDRRKGCPVQAILECKVNGLQITDLATFFERETGKINLDALHPSSMIFSDGFHQAVLKTTSKRLFDLFASLLLLSVTWPIMLAAAVAVRLDSPGPVFYMQERVGRNERRFKVIKFRSMRVDAEADGVAKWASQNDARVTRIGTFLRKSRIDELPQLINVLLGQMSFVGPRPERPEFVSDLEARIPYYAVRHRVNPGITGWAQICYPYGASEEDAREKLQYDIYYIKNYSLFLDLMVLLQTAHVILWGRGAR